MTGCFHKNSRAHGPQERRILINNLMASEDLLCRGADCRPKRKREMPTVSHSLDSEKIFLTIQWIIDLCSELELKD